MSSPHFTENDSPMPTLYHPDLLYQNGSFTSEYGILVGDDGKILSIASPSTLASHQIVRLAGKAILPGFVNGHSHTFQRLIRGRSENRGLNGQDFWTWRKAMYRAALAVDSEDVYHVARMAFLEMVLSGTTAVGEFHYLHRLPDGKPYEDPNLLGLQVIRAAQSVGLRICLLRTAYFRAGYNLPPDTGQIRFYESPLEYLNNMSALEKQMMNTSDLVSIGVAPHSVRAVSLDHLEQIAAWAKDRQYPIHMHMAEQPAEIEACRREYGLSPVRLLEAHQLLSEKLTLVHAIHTESEEVEALARAKVTICSCPTTERNLGDGIIAADQAICKGIKFSFGSDSQAQIDPLEDARELEYHLRLIHKQRVILDQINHTDLSARLFSYATEGGAHSLGIDTGRLQPGQMADFFTVDLDDPSIAGATAPELLPMIVFSLSRSAIRDVFVRGHQILSDGKHEAQQEIVAHYREVHQKVWKNS
jgi:formimidoylglutamate deiminase